MVTKTERLPPMYLKHRGMFNHEELVRALQHWLIDNNYKFNPIKYKLKTNEAEYELEGERDITEYVRFHIYIHIWCRDMTDVEIVKDGEKKKMNEGLLNLEVVGYYDMDYAARFKGNKFLQWLQDFYHKYIIKQTIGDVWEDDLFLKVNQVMGLIKAQLGTEVS